MLAGYRAGVFPMAEGRDDPSLFWVDPRLRGIIPLDGFHMSRSLARSLRRGGWRGTLDRAFDAVVGGCAERPETWINAPLRDLYGRLHRGGAAHSVEVWEGEALVGGVYGVAQGGAFFGESMFSRRRDASKAALAFLVERLVAGGFVLFDTQFLTPHLQSLGGVEVSRTAYRAMLAAALPRRASLRGPLPEPGDVVARLRALSGPA